MGTIATRKKANGENSYTATIRVKDGGVVVLSESQTFNKKALASAWMTRREAELQKVRATGAPEVRKVTVAEILEAYVKQAEGITKWGRSKTADIKRLKECNLANKDARYLTDSDLIEYAESRRTVDKAGPATVLNDIVWLRQAFLSARSLFRLEEPLRAVDMAKAELMRRRVISKPARRSRRISPAEEKQILEYLRSKTRTRIPMVDIVEFALLTARRQEEICRLKWDEVDFESGTAWLDDVKHPTQKVGNRRQFRILKPALEIINRQPKVSEFIFPWDSKSVGTAFTRAMRMIGIDDLHFHDTRHEATSRLFEKGYSIQEVAQFTLHDSWATLQRYTHLRPTDVPER